MRLELDACLSTAEWYDKWFRSCLRPGDVWPNLIRPQKSKNEKWVHLTLYLSRLKLFFPKMTDKLTYSDRKSKKESYQFTKFHLYRALNCGKSSPRPQKLAVDFWIDFCVGVGLRRGCKRRDAIIWYYVCVYRLVDRDRNCIWFGLN